jgi:3-oxoadipate enol-lactonase
MGGWLGSPRVCGFAAVARCGDGWRKSKCRALPGGLDNRAALELALLHPRRVRSLVLVAPGIHDYLWPADDPYFSECDALIAAEDLDGLVRLGLRTWAPAGADGAVAGMLRGAVSSWFEVGELELPGPPAFGRLGEVRAPATMLLGELEYPMVAEVSRAVATRLDGCPTVLVPGADHLLPLRAADRLAAAVAEAVGES